MTTENTAAAAALEDFTAEQAVKVYLHHDAVNHRWTVDPVTLDGYPLDGLDEATSDLHRSEWTKANHAAIDAANETVLPNGDQLVLLLLEALPETSAIKSALTDVLGAATSWAEELTTYIAPASEAHRNNEDAASQRNAAAALHAAVELLSV